PLLDPVHAAAGVPELPVGEPVHGGGRLLHLSRVTGGGLSSSCFIPWNARHQRAVNMSRRGGARLPRCKLGRRQVACARGGGCAGLDLGSPGYFVVRRTYTRLAAVRYALRHWNDPNPVFGNMDTFGAGGDCANFVSQCLLAGGWPLDYRESAVDREWWYRRMGTEPFDRNRDDWWSCTWAVADSHLRYMRANHGQVLLLSA